MRMRAVAVLCVVGLSLVPILAVQPASPASAAGQRAAVGPIGGDLTPTVQRVHMWNFETLDTNSGLADFFMLWNPMGGAYYGMAGDADADGISEPIAYDGFGRWWVTTSSGLITYGIDNDFGLVGDWDGDGIDTIGVWRAGAWYLRNENSTGMADVALGYGNPTDFPVVGDWDGDGVDTVGIFRNGSWYLVNDITHTVADLVVPFNVGEPCWALVAGVLSVCNSWFLLVGDWDSDGEDDLGIKSQSGWYLDVGLTGGPAEKVFGYGDPGDRPIVFVGDPVTFNE